MLRNKHPGPCECPGLTLKTTVSEEHYWYHTPPCWQWGQGTENTPDQVLYPFLAFKHHMELTLQISHVPTVPKTRLSKSTSAQSALYLGQLPSTRTTQSHCQSLDNWACAFWERFTCVRERTKALSHTDPGGRVRTTVLVPAREKWKLHATQRHTLVKIFNLFSNW